MSVKQPWYAGAEGFKDYMLTDEYDLQFTNRRGGHGRAAIKAHPKDALVIIIFYAVILLVLLVLAGPTTGTSGIFGNATVSNNVRNAAATLATLTVVVGLLVAVGIITDII